MVQHNSIDHTGVTGVSGNVAADAIFDAKGDLPVGTGANTAAKLTAGANDTILMAQSGETTGLKWVASQTPSTQNYSDAAAEGTADTYARGDHKHAMPAASGSAHSYLGYNTQGGSTETVTAKRWYCKKITPGSDGLLVSVGAYITDGGGSPLLLVGLYDDNSNAPGRALASSGGAVSISIDGTGTLSRWVTLPLVYFLTSGTSYWMAWNSQSGTAVIAKDGSGSDQHFTHAAGVPYMSTPASITTSTDKYSIRADFIS